MKEIIVAYIENQLLSSNTEIKIGEEEDLLGSGLIDSIGMMKLLAFIEEEFHFKVSPEDMIIENLKRNYNVSDLTIRQVNNIYLFSDIDYPQSPVEAMYCEPLFFQNDEELILQDDEK